MIFISNVFNSFMTFCFINMALGIGNGTFPTTDQDVGLVDIASVMNSAANETNGEYDENTISSENSENVTATRSPMIRVTENHDLLNKLTTTGFERSTNETETAIDDVQSSFNLAIIPTVAVFVFVIIICFKCCKWLHQYTRGGNKDDNFYAVIVTEDDKEYGQIDMLSNSASTICYDTESLSASFLKRSGTESTVGSIQAWRQESLKRGSVKSAPSPIGFRKVLDEPKAKFSNSSKTINGLNEVSSCADTASEQLSVSLDNVPHNKFKVSFMTQTEPDALRNRAPNSNTNHEFKRSSLKKTAKASSNETQTNKTSNETIMVDVGTQTNKSFHYSLRKSKGHFSDSAIDQRHLSKLSTSTLAETPYTSGDKTKDRIENDIRVDIKLAKHSSLTFENTKKSSHSIVIPKISEYPFDTNVEIINNCKQAEGNLELDNEVFLAEIPTDHKLHSKSNKCFDVSNSDQLKKVRKSSKTKFDGLTLSKNICETETCTSVVDKRPKVNDLDSDIKTVIQTSRKSCSLANILEHDHSNRRQRDTSDEFFIQNEGRLSKVSNSTSSSLSLESSGYAEQYSSDSSTCLP